MGGQVFGNNDTYFIVLTLSFMNSYEFFIINTKLTDFLMLLIIMNIV